MAESTEQRREKVAGVACGEGKVGEKDEGLEIYLWVVVAHRERV
jgi:hypothetical protein